MASLDQSDQRPAGYTQPDRPAFIGKVGSCGVSPRATSAFFVYTRSVFLVGISGSFAGLDPVVHPVTKMSVDG